MTKKNDGKLGGLVKATVRFWRADWEEVRRRYDYNFNAAIREALHDYLRRQKKHDAYVKRHGEPNEQDKPK